MKGIIVTILVLVAWGAAESEGGHKLILDLACAAGALLVLARLAGRLIPVAIRFSLGLGLTLARDVVTLARYLGSLLVLRRATPPPEPPPPQEPDRLDRLATALYELSAQVRGIDLYLHQLASRPPSEPPRPPARDESDRLTLAVTNVSRRLEEIDRRLAQLNPPPPAASSSSAPARTGARRAPAPPTTTRPSPARPEAPARVRKATPPPESEDEWLARWGWKREGGSAITGALELPSGARTPKMRIKRSGSVHEIWFLEQPAFTHVCIRWSPTEQAWNLHPHGGEPITNFRTAVTAASGWIFDNWRGASA